MGENTSVEEKTSGVKFAKQIYGVSMWFFPLRVGFSIGKSVFEPFIIVVFSV